MRKTTASQSPKDRHIVSRKQPGLIGEGTTAQQSATAESALTNRFHRTTAFQLQPHCRRAARTVPVPE